MTYKTYTTNKTYQRFVKRWEEVMELPPQNVGPLTPYYHALTRRLKVMPWPMLVAVGVGIAIILYLALGTAITILVTLLQKGF